MHRKSLLTAAAVFLPILMLALLSGIIGTGVYAELMVIKSSSTGNSWFGFHTLGRYLYSISTFAAKHPFYVALKAWFQEVLEQTLDNYRSFFPEQWATHDWFPVLFWIIAAALVAVQVFLIVQLVSVRSLKSKLHYMELQKRLDHQRYSRQNHALSEVENQLRTAQQAVISAEREAEQAKIAERQARAAERQAMASARAAAGMATFMGTITGLTPPFSPVLQPLAALSGSQPVLQAIRTRNLVGLADQITDDEAMAISNIPGLEYIDNPTVTGSPANVMSARKHSIAAALVLLSHMTLQQALVVVNLLSGDMVAGGFGAACRRVVRNQARCDAELNPIFGSIFGDISEFNNRRNGAFLIVSFLIQNVL